MTKINKSFYLKFSFLFYVSIFNISFVYANDLSNAEFQHLSTEHGLSQKTVQAISQDHNGFLWIGTQEGLNRYDGKTIKIFRHLNGDDNSISNDYVRDIIIDKSGNLWIATQGGLNRFKEKNETFEKLEILNSDSNKVTRLNSLFEDDSGNIWIATDGDGLFLLEESVDKYDIKPFDIFDELRNTDVRVVFEDSRGRLWIGTNGKGVFLISADKKQIKVFSRSKNRKNKISFNRIRSITEDHKGQIWIASRGGGISRFNELAEIFTHYQNVEGDSSSLSSNRVYKIFEDNEHRLWIATDGGLSIFQPDKDNFIRIQHHASQLSSLSNNRVLSIFQDSGGIVWFGTQAGLNKWNPVTAKFVHYRHTNDKKNSLSYDYVHGFSEGEDGTLYIATYGGGLNSFEPKNNEFEKIILPSTSDGSVDDYLTTLLIDEKNQLWIGTLSQGVYAYSIGDGKIRNFNSSDTGQNRISADGVTDILQDSDNEIWVSTYRGGLNRLRTGDTSFTQYRVSDNRDGLTNENIFQVMEDDEGYIWMTTDGGGIFKLDKNSGKFRNFAQDPKNSSSLSGNNVTSIYQDSKGRFWIGTQGSGLNRWSPDDRRRELSKFKRYDIENGLNSSTINGIVEDEQGFIWISTNRGVTKLNPESNEMKHYNLADEIHGNEFNVGAILKSQDSRLYFGGLEGISAFYPNEIEQNSHVPNVILTQVTSEGREVQTDEPLSILSKINFSHEDYLISFEFASLDFSQPSKNLYKYKLEGLDNDWINLGRLNRATFTNLPSGKYIFKVKGSNNDGVWSDESINLQVIIEPAPWASWWAFIIYAALFCIFLVTIIRSQAKRIANQEFFQNQVTEKVDSQTALYEKDNEDLKEQVKNYQHNSGNDLSTGLPNQSFFTEQLLISLSWLKSFSKENSLQLFCLIVRLKNDETSENLDSRLIDFAQEISTNEKCVSLIARWSESELAMLGFVESAKQASELAKKVGNCSMKNAIGFSLVPLHKNDEQSYKWENILMLTEHAMRSADKKSQSTESGHIGLVACHQKLTPALIKEIMTSENILNIQDILEIDSNL